MDFIGATDALMAAGVALPEIAGALGVQYSTVRAWRLPTSSPSYRRPPSGWAAKLAPLAAGRGGELQDLAAQLEREAAG